MTLAERLQGKLLGAQVKYKDAEGSTLLVCVVGTPEETEAPDRCIVPIHPGVPLMKGIVCSAVLACGDGSVAEYVVFSREFYKAGAGLALESLVLQPDTIVRPAPLVISLPDVRQTIRNKIALPKIKGYVRVIPKAEKENEQSG